MENQILFTTYDLSGITINNKIVMAPMTRSRADNEGNIPTPMMAEYYAQRASAGLIISEGIPVSKKAVGYINVPGIYSEAQVEGWKLITKAVHEKGGKIFAQLWHVGRLSHPSFFNGELPHAPSAINANEQSYTVNGLQDTVVPKEMTIEDIHQTIFDFKNAAANALKAGFDGVEIHAANGYLLHQFFNATSNHRVDIYGGSEENRARILFEILDAMKLVIDLSKVGVRLNPSLHGAMGMTMDTTTIPTFNYIVKHLSNYNLAYLHLTEPFVPVDDIPFAVKQVATHFRPLYKGTLIINKGFTIETATKVLVGGDADLVAFGVPFIANPDLVKRLSIGAPLNQPDPTTFYTPGAKGYIDYPMLAE